MGGEELVDVFEGVDDGLEFADCVGDVGLPGEVVVDLDSQEFGGFLLLEGGVADGDGEVGVIVGVENRVCSFGWIGDEVVAV